LNELIITKDRQINDYLGTLMKIYDTIPVLNKEINTLLAAERINLDQILLKIRSNIIINWVMLLFCKNNIE